ncbi:SDR family NAD(P)-dependent oxidoreductase [Chitinimonas sp. PSY-7]|uniref:SDR family NAD(P)-dependent oxidoreductase n=1 Tax=Chitinimonas sp. PSY-7 TaxID=3459088 RepID=UPI00404001B4
MSEKTFDNKVALVVGASRNMGRAFAELLGAEGASVAVHYNSASSQTGAEAAVAAIRESGGQAFAIQADITRVAEIERLFTAVQQHFGGIDIAINTAWPDAQETHRGD